MESSTPSRDTARTMSQEHVDLVYRLADALNARQVPEFIALDYRLENVNTAVTNKTYQGVDGLREWMRDLFSAFAEGARFQVDEIVADGDDYVVVISSIVGRGAASDAPLQLRWFSAVWFRGSEMTRSAGFLSKREALKAVGLSE
jgi:ketosteroid isomerase-like protein